MNTPLMKITDLEMKAIECHINDNAEESLQTSPQYILREWDDKKQGIFDLFGQELILSKNATFTKNASQIASEMDYAWDEKMSNSAKQFWRDFSEFCNQQRQKIYPKPRWMVEPTEIQLKREQDWYRCEQILNNTTLANNSVQEEFTVDLPKPDGSIRQYHVQKGSRPMRVMGKLLQAYKFGDEDGFKEFCVWHSQMLNEKKIAGKFCLSIHPLDYMTMSENTHGWTSCMNWEENGCYRAGTVEMMNSPMVIVAYMCSDHEKMDLNAGWDSNVNRRQHLEWNSKKWRTLIVVNQFGIFSVKSYPYYHHEMTQYAMEWIASLFKDRHFEECEVIRPYRDYTLRSGLVVNFTPRTYRMYNDFGAAKHFIMLDTDLKIKLSEMGEEAYGYPIDFVYSGASECMSCGDLSYYEDYKGVHFDGEVALCCDSCWGHPHEDESTCDMCGEVWSNEDMVWVEDQLVCPECFNNECFEDALTYNYCFNEDGIKLFFDFQNGEKPVEVGMVHYDTIEEIVKEELMSTEKFQEYKRNEEIILAESELDEESGLRYWKRIKQEEEIRNRYKDRDPFLEF